MEKVKPASKVELSKESLQHFLSLILGDKGVKVESTNIDKIGHDGNDPGWLVIRFNNGSIYAYHPVSIEGFHGIIQAESSGKYFNDNIKSNPGISCFKLQDKS